MTYSFNIKSDRSGKVPWLKEYFTPDAIKNEGLLGYAGAEFEFATCPAFCRGVMEIAQKGTFGYSLIGDDYRNAVKWWMKNVRGWEIEPEWIVPTHGTIFSLATAIRLLTKEGENIIVLPPNYNRYNQAAERLNRGVCSVPLIETETGFRLDKTGLEEAFGKDENKLLVICNPNNPTGSILDKEELSFIAELSGKYGVAVFSDEIFAEVVFGENRVTPYSEIAGEDSLAITCTSMGKVFSLTGVNHANVIISDPALRDRYLAQRNADHFGSVDPMVYAGMLEAYSPEGRDWVLELNRYLWDNYLVFDRFLKEHLPKAKLIAPQGTFVLWVDYSAYGDRWNELDRLMREKGMLAGDEGEEYYGKPSCVRYSIAVPREELEKTLARAAEALKDFEV